MGEEAKDFKGIITMVALKQDGKWLIRAVQNTVSIPAMTKPSERVTEPSNLRLKRSECRLA